jgi:hypothetical protein
MYRLIDYIHLLDAHSFRRSPYYQGQYQSANGKVIAIEQEAVITMSGKLFVILSSGVRRAVCLPSLPHPHPPPTLSIIVVKTFLSHGSF